MLLLYLYLNILVIDITVIISMYQHGILEVGFEFNKDNDMAQCCSAQFNTREIMLCLFLFLMCSKLTTFPHITLFVGSTFYIRLEMLHSFISSPQMAPLSALRAT